jgi:MoxR-like ATPase
MSSDEPEPADFDDEDGLKIAVDGRVIAELREIDDFLKSPADEAAVVTMLQVLADDAAEDFEEEHDVDPVEAVRATEPEISLADEEHEWETIPVGELAGSE